MHGHSIGEIEKAIRETIQFGGYWLCDEGELGDDEWNGSETGGNYWGWAVGLDAGGCGEETKD